MPIILGREESLLQWLCLHSPVPAEILVYFYFILSISVYQAQVNLNFDFSFVISIFMWQCCAITQRWGSMCFQDASGRFFQLHLCIFPLWCILWEEYMLYLPCENLEAMHWRLVVTDGGKGWPWCCKSCCSHDVVSHVVSHDVPSLSWREERWGWLWCSKLTIRFVGRQLRELWCYSQPRYLRSGNVEI